MLSRGASGRSNGASKPGPPAGQMQAVGPSFGRRLAKAKAKAKAEAEAEAEAEAQLEKRVAVSFVALYGISKLNQ